MNPLHCSCNAAQPVLLGLPAQRLIGCAYPPFAYGLCAGTCVLAVICQSASGLEVKAGLGGCAGYADGAQFALRSTFYVHLELLMKAHQVFGVACVAPCLGHAALHASPFDDGNALRSDYRD